MTSSTVSMALHANIAVLSISNPPVNALSQSVRQGIRDNIEKAISDEAVEAIVITCEGKTFIAGADISEFGAKPLEPHLPDVLNSLQNSPKPIIAALFGTVLGGGFETALSCHYRVALKGTKVGLPEVNLGLIPGAGGTQLLPRVCYLETALDMITSGKHVDVSVLESQGTIDQIVEDELIDNAILFAKNVLAQDKPLISIPELTVKAADSTDTFQTWRKKLAKRARGQQAPQKAIDSIENAINLPFADGVKREREYFLSCRESSQSASLRHAFFAEKAASKYKGRQGSPSNTDKIKSVAVIGAGTMGGGIAMCFANAGFPIVLVETSDEYLNRGLDGIKKRYAQMVERKRINQQQMDSRLSLISGTCDYQQLSDVDLVVEAAFESMEVKKDIFVKLDTVCKPGTILATNTSYLDIEEIAACTSRPQKVLGMHFFSPANIMKLLEVVRASQTDDMSVDKVMRLGKQIGKISVLVGVCYGFVGNRMYSCYGREANMLLLEGASPEQIDTAMFNWGMAMGPLAVNDMSGIDIAYKARKENPNLPKDPAYFAAANLMVEAGRLGQKTKAGFYQYDEKGAKATDQSVITIFEQESANLGIKRREITAEEIESRLILALINEGARILEENIAHRSSDIDVIWLNGYGFPRYKGGPMFYADMIGLDNVVKTLQEYYDESGKEWWKPANLLTELASSGKSFSDI
jgi:3-hydroxyacyl-CoA dehydrogenase